MPLYTNCWQMSVFKWKLQMETPRPHPLFQQKSQDLSRLLFTQVTQPGHRLESVGCRLAENRAPGNPLRQDKATDVVG